MLDCILIVGCLARQLREPVGARKALAAAACILRALIYWFMKSHMSTNPSLEALPSVIRRPSDEQRVPHYHFIHTCSIHMLHYHFVLSISGFLAVLLDCSLFGNLIYLLD